MMSMIARLLSITVTPLLNLIYWVGRLIPGLKKIPRISLPLRYALLSFIALLMIAGMLFIRYRYAEHSATLDQFLRYPVVLAGLLLAIPVCVYFAVRMLLQGTASNFPDIDFAWRQGLDALQANGVDVTQTPIFLVLGSPDHSSALNLHRASRISMNVKQVPEGPGALHWYANQTSIFLFLTNASCLSRLAATAKGLADAGRPAAGAAAPVRTPAGYTGTIQAGGGGGGPAGPQATLAGPAAGRIDEQTVRTDGGTNPPPVAAAAAMQTMQANPLRSLTAPVAAGPVAATEPYVKPQLGPADVNLQTARLEHVCGLIRRLRTPVCPINGALVLLPFQLVEQAPEQFQALVQRDLAVVRDQLKLRFPVTVLVHELEREPGFRELVRRVGVDRARVQRFGKGSDVWTPPTAPRLEAIAKHACGAFEDWSYMLFREHDGLRKPGNAKLFSLLCRVRGDFVQNLERILAFGLGSSGGNSRTGDEDGLMFSGCYFAATGDTDDRQAFVQSVLQKLVEQESEISWTQAALAEDETNQFYANLLGLAGVLSLIGLLAMLAINFHWFDRWVR